MEDRLEINMGYGTAQLLCSHSKNTAHIKMILARDKGARVWCHIQDLYSLKVSFAFFGVKKVGKPSFYITTYAPQFVALHLLFSGVRFF